MEIHEFVDKYYVERKGTQSLKWDQLEERFGSADLLPLWVADMDFKVSEAITKALKDRVNHGVYGYTYVAEGYYEALDNWMATHFNWSVKAEWVRFSTNVVKAIYDVIHTYTQDGDAVIIQTPVYYPFANAIKDTKRQLVNVDLINTDGHFTLDYDAFEQAIVANDVKLYIHCSPHNPVGRVWTAEEAEKLFEICYKHGVLVLSDEIHQDFTYDVEQIPSALLSEGKYNDRLITVNSASKSFNIAALTLCHVIITDDTLREQYDAYMQRVGQAELNVMGILATEAAYVDGEDWLETIKKVIHHNYHLVCDYVNKYAPEIVVSPLEGTYLLFLDLGKVVAKEEMKTFVQDRCKLAVDYGDWFGEGYDRFIRLNLATKPDLVEEAIRAIVENLG